jgi:hypothetical protein
MDQAGSCILPMFSANVPILLASIESIDVVPVRRHSTSSFAFLIKKIEECVGIVDFARKAHSTADDGDRFVRDGSSWVARILCSSVGWSKVTHSAFHTWCAVDICVVLVGPIGCGTSEVGCHGFVAERYFTEVGRERDLCIYDKPNNNSPLVLLRVSWHHLLPLPCQKTNGHSGLSHAKAVQHGMISRCLHAMHMACSCTCLQA